MKITSSLSERELQERRIALKERVQRSRTRKKALLEQIENEMSYVSSSAEADTDQTIQHHRCSYQFHFQKEERLLKNENNKAMTDCTKR